MQIKAQQQRDSIRFVWNTMAANKALQAKSMIPQALHYTPLDYNQQTILKKIPPKCAHCQSYMNPYNRIQLGKQHYTCCICKKVNEMPHNYLTEKESMPPELTLPYSTFLLAEKRQSKHNQIGLAFVVDIAISEKQLAAVKEAILELIKSLDDEKAVTLITYNKYVQLYDLASQIQNVVTFNPNHRFTDQQFLNLLEIKQQKVSQMDNLFSVKLKNCRASFIQQLQNIERVKELAYKGQRESRAVGQALNVAISLCQNFENPLKVIFFCGGICTIGLGKVIQPQFKTQLRSIKQQLPRQSKIARQFYQRLGEKAKLKSIAIDSFIFSVEEVGLTEMLPCLKATNGLLVQHQQFSSKIFKQSFNKAYIGTQKILALSLATQARIQLKLSNQIKLTGFQGRVDNQQVNSRFYVGNLNENSTITATFEQSSLNTQSQAFYIQIRTTYEDIQNLNIKFERVTTIRRLFAQTTAGIIASFDQEAALYLLTKLCTARPEGQKNQSIRSWLDNLTIKWASMFGKYTRGHWESFQLPENVRLFPQFLYYLRRNIIVRKSRVSLDEYSYACQIMKWQPIRNVLLMIQPALLIYTTDQPFATAVGLDEKFMKSEVILVLDSFFNIIEWRGKHIQGWFQENYHLSSDYGYLQEMHKNTTKDIEELKSERFPSPTVYTAWPNHSKQRFIKSRLGNRQEQQQEGNISDEADIRSFTSKLIQIVVNN